MRGDPALVRAAAEAARARTGTLFIVVTDARGIRFSHPDRSRIGQPVSTDPSEALRGREVALTERGTLGYSARGKVPLRAADGRIVGEVSVGIDAAEVSGRSGALLRLAALFLVLALLPGGAGTVLLARRLRRQTLGLEPVDLTDLVREREAVLHCVDEGVLAVDRDGRVTVCNDAAARLLGHAPAPGTPLADAGLPPRLRATLAERRAERAAQMVAGERVLVVTARPVAHGAHDLGHVLTLRDRTELDQLTRELGVVRALSDALRAQTHEYTNRLHALAGLLRLGHVEEALAYLHDLAHDPLATEDGADTRLGDPYLRGLLAAKTAVASEHGVRLRLAPESYLPEPLAEPLDVVTVLGNLTDNAVTAARRGRRRPAWVEVSVLGAGADLHLAVADSGDGVPAGARDRVFEDGFSTSADRDRPHGIGLALARQVARARGGDVTLDRASGPGCGATFAARLPGAVAVPPGTGRAPAALEEAR
nr:sensor histidine kinase [Actinomadura rayongensis]